MSLLRICYQHCYFSCSLALFLMLSLLRAASRLNRSRLASPSTTLSYLIGIGSGKISFEASLQAKICYNFVVKSPAICYYERVQGVLIKERGTIHEKHILLYEVVQPFRDKSVSNTHVIDIHIFVCPHLITRHVSSPLFLAEALLQKTFSYF